MDLGRVKELIDLFADTDLAELDLREGDCQLRLARRPRTADARTNGGCRPGEAETPSCKMPEDTEPPAPSSTPTGATEPVRSQAQTDAREVLAPMHGVLHLAPTPGAPPFVNLGDRIRCGQTLAVLEAMKVFTALRSDADGLLAAIMAASGSEVAAGQPLFRIT